MNSNRKWNRLERIWYWLTGVTPSDALARRPRPRLCEKCGELYEDCECEPVAGLSARDRYGLDFQGMER